MKTWKGLRPKPATIVSGRSSNMATKPKPKTPIPAVSPSVIPVPSGSPASGRPASDPVRPFTPEGTRDGDPGPGRGGSRPGAGRPSSAPKPVAKIPQFTKAGLARLWQLVFGMVAIRRGDDWTLDDDEAGNLAEATDAGLQQYLPLLAEHAALTALVITLGITVAPRVMIDMHEAKVRRGSSPTTKTPEADRPSVKVRGRVAGKPGKTATT
jgi:hypothetical protein